MSSDMNPMDSELERAIAEIRDEAVDAAVIEAAGARVWAHLAEAAAPGLAVVAPGAPSGQIRGCEDIRALLPDYRAGRLPESRAMLVKDHLHQCVACRRVYEGKLIAFPKFRSEQAVARRPRRYLWLAAAAAVAAAAGGSLWMWRERSFAQPGRAYVQAINGALYEILPTGVQPLAVGQDLPEGVEIRTAKDSSAVVHLRDGTTVELRERSSFTASQSGIDTNIALSRGAAIVQAAKRRTGHLYVETGDCRTAVTGTVFSVNAGAKGSRISVMQGEVRVTQDNREKVLHPGDQTETSPNLDPVPIQDAFSWSQQRDRLGIKPVSAATLAAQPDALLRRIPASAALVIMISDAAQASRDARSSLLQAEQNPQLRAMMSGGTASFEPLLAKLAAAGEYLGETAMVVLSGPDNKSAGPVFLATVKRTGFRDLIQKAGLAVEERPGLALFGPSRDAVQAAARALDSPQGGFESSPCYARLAEAGGAGADSAICADLSRLGKSMQGARYFAAQERRVNGHAEVRATLGYDGPRTGIAAWLAPPAPMGSLDYISPDAGFVAAFVVKDSGAMVDELLGFQNLFRPGAQKALADAQQKQNSTNRDALAPSLGGEFALAMDGPLFPTPSWRLVAEVYDPVRFQAALQKLVEVFNSEALKNPGAKPLRTGQETVDGRTYHLLGSGDPNPLLEAHYAYDDGYFIAGPTRAAVAQAIQTRTARTSIARSSRFLSLMPRDHYANFSAVVYQNLGPTLGPLAGLLGAFAPPQAGGRAGQIPNLGNIKPTFFAAYGETDRITIASSGETLGIKAGEFANGSLLGIAGAALPLGQVFGTSGRRPAYR